MKPAQSRQAGAKGARGGGRSSMLKGKTKTVDKEGGDPNADPDEGGAAPGGVEDDEAIAAFFQEAKAEARTSAVVRKVSGYQGLDIVRLGPDFVDDDYNECTPVPLWQRPQPIVNYDTFLERTDDEIVTITPIKPQTFSQLFAFYRDRSPALNWDPHLTDLEEDCFYQDLIHWPSKKMTHTLPHESKKEPVPKKRVKVFKPSGDYIYKTRLTIELQETGTLMLFEIKGVMVLETDPKVAEVKTRNERYAEMVKDHLVSDTYANDFAQSYEEYSLSKYTDYKIRGCQDAGSQVHTYTIVDEYIKVAEEDAKQRIIEQDEAAARALAEKARLEIPTGGWKDSDSDDSDEEKPTDVLDYRTDITKYKDDDLDNNRALILDEASDDDIPMTDDDEEYEIHQSLEILYRNKTTMENKRPPRNYPDISFSLIAMERIICMDSQQMRQADMRGLIEPEQPKTTALHSSKSDDEDETKAGEGELDEDAMVSLLIQQHRLQEQLEKQSSIDTGVPTIIIPDAADMEDHKDADDDDDLLQEANAAEEAERKRQEQKKADEEAAAAAAAAAALAAQKASETPEERDEFDQAVAELEVAVKGGADIAEILAEQQSQTQQQYLAPPQDQTQAPDDTSAAGGPPTSTMEVPSITGDTTTVGGDSSKHDATPPIATSDKQTADGKPAPAKQQEVKTIVPPSQSRPATGIGSTTPSQMVSTPSGKASELACSWTDIDEKYDDDRKMEEELAAGVPDVVDDLPLDLPQLSPEDVLSDTEEDFTNKANKKDFTSDMAEIDEHEEGGGATAITIPSGSGEQKAPINAAAHRLSAEEDAEATEKKKSVEVDEYDDISSDETHHENSVLSDHLELSEDCSTDSEASLKVTNVWQSANPLNKMYMDWAGGKDPLDADSGPMATGPNLRQYWTFKCSETAGMEVTDITLHPLNENIIAATYGSVRFGDHEKEGLVCIWNAKNNRSPERIYRLRAPGTSLAFSELTPFVLAVGMLDGNVVLFDVREADAVILGATVDQKTYYGHLGPVWQVYFVIQVDASNEDIVEEFLLTLGDDGLFKKWSITKGLESSILMKVTRSTMQVPGRREKRSESLITTLSIAYTVAFYPTNSDLFLLGTEEGFIHKCSSAYKESYISTYVGHTGPVYRVAFSNFDDTVFFSCAGDWTVKMWKLDHPVPLLSLQTGHRTIFDVTCSFFHSTVFICATEYHIEVWDLSVNTLEPVVQYKPAFALGLRKVAFNGLLNSVIIGDDEGSLTIYGLRNFPKPPATKDAKRELLLESLLPGYKRKKEAEEAERLRKHELEQARMSM